jgi:predicted DNA binding CopG/RHH family protein
MEINMLATKEPEPTFLPADDNIMELSLMMSRRQFEALQQRARSQGMSVAQYLRRLIQDSVTDELPLACPD